MNKKFNAKQLTLLGLMTALLLLMSFTPLGYLNIGPLAITFNVIPVAVSALALGPVGGLIAGSVFGLTSFLQAIGVGGAAMAKRGEFWLTVHSRVDFYEPAYLMDALTAQTWPERCEGRDIRCFRSYRLLRHGLRRCVLKYAFLHVRTHPAFRADRVHAGLDQRPKHSAVRLRVRRRQCRVRDALVHRHHRRRRQCPLKSRVYSNTR